MWPLSYHIEGSLSHEDSLDRLYMAVSSDSHELVVAELEHAERCSEGNSRSVVQDYGLALNQPARNLNVGILCMCQRTLAWKCAHAQYNVLQKSHFTDFSKDGKTSVDTRCMCIMHKFMDM